MLDPNTCHRALIARDVRFDGRFFVGVTTTGIYCRPVCPAGPARPENCRYFVSAAAAGAAGFRPCLRCRPESAPGSGAWRGTSTVVARALRLIAEGAFDGDSTSVEAFADRVGVGARQLRRLFSKHLGASPIAVVQTQRVHLAKQLLHDTDLSMTEVALASGFGSLRRFNETFRALYKRPPSKLRKARSKPFHPSVTAIELRLPYRSPYDWPSMLRFLADRAVVGVERVSGEVYARTISHEGITGIIEVGHLPAKRALRVMVQFPNLGALGSIIAGIRRMFDLDADVQAIGRHLRRDPLLARLVDVRPGLRVPGGWSGWEVGVRAVLGEQVSLEQGRRRVERFVREWGVSVQADDEPLSRIFPGPAELLTRGARVTFGIPKRRRAALDCLAQAALSDTDCFRASATTAMTVARLGTIPGIGDWTAHNVAMRAAHDPDAFPASDVVLRRSDRSAAQCFGIGQPLARRAERWRPWRAYAAQHLWSDDSAARETS